MQRLSIYLAALLALTQIAPAAAQSSAVRHLLRAKKSAPVWSTSAIHSSLLGGGTSTITSGSTSNANARSAVCYGTGEKRVFAFTVSHTSYHIGGSTSSHGLTSDPGNDGANSFSMWSGDGTVYRAGIGAGAGLAVPRSGHTYHVALSTVGGNPKVWYYNPADADGPQWNNAAAASQDPGTDTGGYTWAIGAGPWCINFATTDTTAGRTITLVAPTVIPSGFSAW
jgi:hypothetical protein